MITWVSVDVKFCLLYRPAVKKVMAKISFFMYGSSVWQTKNLNEQTNIFQVSVKLKIKKTFT